MCNNEGLKFVCLGLNQIKATKYTVYYLCRACLNGNRICFIRKKASNGLIKDK